MTIDFGSIKSYNPDKGFGFVKRTFFNSNEKVFFHIKKVKKKHLDLAQKLDNGEAFEKFNFWYEVETNDKGEQVSKLWLNSGDIPQTYAHELCDLIQKVESIWKNVDLPKPSWLDLVTIQLAGDDRRHELSVERDNLESQIRAAEQVRLKEAEFLRQNEIRRISKEHHLKDIESEELEKLLKEMRPLGFTHSKQLSAYIVKQQPGYRYPHISGIVIMEEGGTQWKFPGGFPPHIYTVICRELNLANQGSGATVISWDTYEGMGYTK
jgi:cold shock CspA family protein